MLYNFSSLFILFLIYSIIGYLTEVIAVTLTEKKLVLNRGFLIGPYLPIYGSGALGMVLLLEKYQHDIIALFIMSVVICSILEYMTSLVMEKIFKLRWWDYSTKRFNINGRICLENSVLFGLGGVLIVKVINPLISGVVYTLPSIITILLGIILCMMFIADIIESTYITFRLKINVNKYINQDATREIKKEVMKALQKHTTLTTRLLNAFPNIQHEATKNFLDFKKLAQKTKEEALERKKQRKRKQERLQKRRNS